MHDPTFDIPEEKPEEIYPLCPECGGMGLKCINPEKLVRWEEDYEKCPNCGGKGYIVPEEDDEIPY